MGKNRQQRKDDELVNASEDLYYEISMMRTTAQGLISGVANPSAIQNALLESFLLHVRILLDFLSPPRRPPLEDDVIATDYAPTWKTVDTADGGKYIEMLREEINKRLAHLTYKRLKIADRDKGWNFIGIEARLVKWLHEFLRSVPDERLCDEAKSYRRQHCSAAEQ